MSIRALTRSGLRVTAVLAALPCGLMLVDAIGACDSSSGTTPSLQVDASADGPDACTELGSPDGAPMRVTGTVSSKKGDAAPTPLANAMISAEYGGLYLPYCDRGRASPYYVFGAVSDDAGTFSIDVKEGLLGFHSFANDHYYSRAKLDTREAGTVALTMERLPDGHAKPTIANAAFDKTSVGPGEPVTFTATLATWDAKDPLSDENVLVESTHSWSLELDPPAVGKPDDFADGLWKRTFAAPASPGTYTYWFSATTAGCVTSDLVMATLTVR